jgi:peptide/nickel transport system permease protein
MSRFLLRRLLIIPIILVVVNFIGFTYAHAAGQFHAAQNPFGSSGEKPPAIWPLYVNYVQNIGRGNFGQMPVGVSQSVAQGVARAAGASLGLLMLAFVVSTLTGLVIGLRAVRTETGSVAAWLMPLSTIGLATPSFYIGTLFIVGTIYYVLRSGVEAKPPVPLQGFGWDIHLLLPLVALSVRPIVQIAQVTANLLAGESGQQYIVAARSRGNSWARVRWKHALRNVLAPIILTIAGSLRLLVGELILIEWLFAWPGLGRLLALALIPPNVATPGGLTGHTIYFLHPELVAALLTMFTLIFLVVDTLASTLVRWADPRLRATETTGGKQ